MNPNEKQAFYLYKSNLNVNKFDLLLKNLPNPICILMDKLTLIYSNDDDRAYGLAGMTISLAALDALSNVSSVSLDSDGPMITFSHEFYFTGSPSISPKATWNNLLNNFNLTAAMVVSNVMARSLVRLKDDVPGDIMKQVYQAIVNEGKESVDLEEDEIAGLYSKIQTYMGRIFRNPRLHPAIHDYVRTLSRRRSLTGSEIADELHLLQLI